MAAPTEADLRAIFALRPAAAIEYLERKGFAITWNWHDVDAATHARALTVARAARLDVFQDIRDALVENLERGETLRDFKRSRPTPWKPGAQLGSPGVQSRRMAAPRSRNKAARAAWIPSTRPTCSRPIWQGARPPTKRKPTPYWMYVAVMDGVTRPSHAALHGKVFRNDPIWHITPPSKHSHGAGSLP
ncbi:phage head morphogenesis protein [Pseudomonas aeruginosa]|uniref:phage head morphogenesis protein n=1 Tax=Pseudomonas aeruginosa TaxID=287 RepID=UPI003D7F1C93